MKVGRVQGPHHGLRVVTVDVWYRTNEESELTPVGRPVEYKVKVSVVGLKEIVGHGRDVSGFCYVLENFRLQFLP